MNVEIRDYDEQTDLQALRACVIELQEYERQYEPLMPPGREMIDAYLELTLGRCQTWKGKVFVAAVDKEVVGFTCVWGRVKSEEPDDNPADYAYISDLIVLADYRRRGIGRRLVDVAETYARSCGVAVLRVQALARNDGACSFYGRHGFNELQIEFSKRLT